MAGWFVSGLGQLPGVGDRMTEPGTGAAFEVVELDGRRIARLRVTPGAHGTARPPDAQPDAGAATQQSGGAGASGA